jgi:hypothetical protein
VVTEPALIRTTIAAASQCIAVSALIEELRQDREYGKLENRKGNGKRRPCRVQETCIIE